MTITTVSSRKFNQDVSGAKRSAFDGPVFITDQGHPTHVLLTIEQYQRLTGNKENIVELLAMDNSEEIEFPPYLKNKFFQPTDLS